MDKYRLTGLLFLCIAIFGCGRQTPKNEIITGNFKSIRGTMDMLSCYCYNAGYIATSENNNIPICFQYDKLNIYCQDIQVKGYYKNTKVKLEPNNPCPAGEMTLFYVSSYECK
jgi:hypothetical protein